MITLECLAILLDLGHDIVETHGVGPEHGATGVYRPAVTIDPDHVDVARPDGDALFKDGTRLPITGIPEDNPTNDSSPYKLVAKCRDAKVPYSFPFAEGLSKYKSKKNDAATAPNIISAPYLKRVQESMQQKSPF